MSSEGGGRVTARWHGTVVATSTATITVEGNHYFPPEDVRWEHLRPSTQTTRCIWKGTAAYWDVVVGGAVNRDAAWAYPAPSRPAARIRGHVAFWHGVTVSQDDETWAAPPAAPPSSTTS